MDTSVWWSGDLFSAMRTTLGADRAREHLEAHVKGDTVTHSHLRAEHVVDWATRGGARAMGRDDLGRLQSRTWASADSSGRFTPTRRPGRLAVSENDPRTRRAVRVHGRVGVFGRVHVVVPVEDLRDSGVESLGDPESQRSSIVAYGPARIREKSATTSPASGP